jgi:hypothetical protein
MSTRGRPKVSPLLRDEQLRRAKHKQRARQRAAGVVNVQLALPKDLAERLRVALRSPDMMPALESLLDRQVIRFADYPQLRDIAWNRADVFVSAREAFQLYERNWRFIDVARLDDGERALIDRLADEYGNGVING